MAKDNKKIVGSVRLSGITVGKKRMPGKLFTPGMEDELQAAADVSTIERLTEKGVIAGFSVKAEKAAAKAEETDEASNEAKGKDSDKK